MNEQVNKHNKQNQRQGEQTGGCQSGSGWGKKRKRSWV